MEHIFFCFGTIQIINISKKVKIATPKYTSRPLIFVLSLLICCFYIVKKSQTISLIYVLWIKILFYSNLLSVSAEFFPFVSLTTASQLSEVSENWTTAKFTDFISLTENRWLVWAERERCFAVLVKERLRTFQLLKFAMEI